MGHSAGRTDSRRSWRHSGQPAEAQLATQVAAAATVEVEQAALGTMQQAATATAAGRQSGRLCQHG
ncbi:MAG: hypothetical protein R3E31_19305 [Chloroflexota bacterium]